MDIITQKIHPVDKGRKPELLSHLIRSENWHQALVFSRTKHGADKLVRRLARDSIKATAIHGNKSQPQRTKALAGFKHNKIQILVATDIAARGIDIDQLSHVVNFDLPNVPEYYIHRIGRTGRAGASGIAISLVSADEIKQLEDIERLIKRKIDQEIIEGFEPHHFVPESIHAKPHRNNRQPNRARRNNNKRSPNERRSHGISRRSVGSTGRKDNPRNHTKSSATETT